MDPQAARKRVLGLISSSLVSRALCAAAELEIPDKLKSGPKGLTELATLTNCSTEHLGRLLRALVSIGLFRAKNGDFELTPLSDCLTRDAKNSVWAAAVMQGHELFRAQAHLTSNVRDGIPGWDHAHGSTIWKYLSDHQTRAVIFDAMMTSIHGDESDRFADVYDFSHVRVLVDVGGGNGSLLSAILTKNAQPTGILFDLPHVVSRAASALVGSPLAARIRVVGGNFFTAIPSGGDVYLLRHVLHDWDENEALQILKACRNAMHEHARILILEHIHNEHSDLAWADLAMMVCGGKERSLARYQELAFAAGFSQIALHRKNSLTVIEAHAS